MNWTVFVTQLLLKKTEQKWLKNKFQNVPRKKFILIQLPELLTDQTEVTKFGFLIEFYVKLDLSKFVRHLLGHPILYLTYEKPKRWLLVKYV